MHGSIHATDGLAYFARALSYMPKMFNGTDHRELEQMFVSLHKQAEVIVEEANLHQSDASHVQTTVINLRSRCQFYKTFSSSLLMVKQKRLGCLSRISFSGIV